MAQALVRYLSAQRTEIDGVELPLVAGMFAIFGHGNVAGLGEALYAARVELPTLRAHNEQAMAHAAIAFAKAYRRYGYSCMGYEIAGGLGAKMAMPDREVFVLVGDGSYLMLNSEIATSVTMGLRLVIVVLDNHGFGCINRLQQACGGPPFGNLLTDPVTGAAPTIDFASHARSLGAIAEPVKTIADLEAALERARTARRTSVIVIETDPAVTTAAGGAWWDVAVPAESSRPEVRAARAAYVEARRRQQIGR
jgi:3D-(3,5/4)-trihydroxycyclohexane-1,2-dione acylhydrolase (decyclizing)